MFIPNPKTIEVGDFVYLCKTLTIFAGSFTNGHRFKVTEIGERGYSLQDDDGRQAYEVNGSYLTKSAIPHKVM